MQMPAVVPLFIADGNFASTLVLVNGSSVQTYADVTVRSLDGKTVATKRVQFQPDSQQQLNLRTLLNSAGAAGTTTGSIIVMQSSDLSGVVITAVLSMTRLSPSQPNYIDQEISMPSAAGSQILRAVADKGEGSPIVAITSLSTVEQHVQVQCLGKNDKKLSKAVVLSAGETLLTSACSEETLHGADFQSFAGDFRDEPQGPIGIALTSDAMPGSFAAFALAPHGPRERRYFSSVSFTDPKMLMSSTTVFTGVPVGSAVQLTAGKYTPAVALANFANKDTRVTVRYAQTSGDTPNTQDVETVTVPAQSSKEVSLAGLIGDPNLQNSFLIVSDGGPGDVVAKLVARSDSQLREVELLGKDLKNPQNGGNHPWSLENGTNSTLLLFNTSGVPRYFNVAISAGLTVWRKAYQLQPLQTKAISFLDLITNEVKDDKGNLLPKDIWSGQVQWHSPSANAGRGRLIQSNPDKAMARNFSCGFVAQLCEVDFAGTSYQANGSTVTFGSMNPYVCANTCSGTPVGPGGVGYGYSWSSSDSAIASVSGASDAQSVQTYGASSGGTDMNGYSTDDYCTAYLSAAPANVCDFSIVPTGAAAASCSGGQSTQTFNATITPSESACHRVPASNTTCGVSDKDGAIDGVTVTLCTDSNGIGPVSRATYYAGPGTSGAHVGDLSAQFSLQFPGATISHTQTVSITCP
jgi:hypothetical protein